MTPLMREPRISQPLPPETQMACPQVFRIVRLLRRWLRVVPLLRLNSVTPKPNDVIVACSTVPPVWTTSGETAWNPKAARCCPTPCTSTDTNETLLKSCVAMTPPAIRWHCRTRSDTRRFAVPGLSTTIDGKPAVEPAQRSVLPPPWTRRPVPASASGVAIAYDAFCSVSATGRAGEDAASRGSASSAVSDGNSVGAAAAGGFRRRRPTCPSLVGKARYDSSSVLASTGGRAETVLDSLSTRSRK